MARKRYVIWDEKSDVYCPSGEVLSAEQWLNRYPIARLETEKLVVSGGSYNGAFCMPFGDMVDIYEKAKCDFSACETEQDYLDAIEAFEDARNEVISTEERIAAALEYQNLMLE